MNRVIITKPMIGICFMQVCVEKGTQDREVLEVCNAENPSGTRCGWNTVYRKNRAEKNLRPVQCEAHADRIHLIVAC